MRKSASIKSKSIDLLDHQIRKLTDAMRPPPDIRPKLDIGYTYENHILTLFEICPGWDDSGKVIEMPFARARYIKSKGCWKLYWMRGSGKWEPYDPVPEVSSVEQFFQVVEEDKYCCFKG